MQGDLSSLITQTLRSLPIPGAEKVRIYASQKDVAIHAMSPLLIK